MFVEFYIVTTSLSISVCVIFLHNPIVVESQVKLLELISISDGSVNSIVKFLFNGVRFLIVI